MREIPFDNDGDYTEQKFKDRYEADLANGLGNLTNRVLTMVEKYSKSVVPKVSEVDTEMIEMVKTTVKNYNDSFARWRFDHALEEVNKLITYCDQKISDQKPWAMAKAGQDKEVQNLLHHLCEALRHIAVMLYPVLPATTEKIFTQLGLEVAVEFAKPLTELQDWVELTVGNTIIKGEQLFPRL